MQNRMKKSGMNRSIEKVMQVWVTQTVEKRGGDRRDETETQRTTLRTGADFFLILLGLSLGGLGGLVPTLGLAQEASPLKGLMLTLEERAKAGVASTLIFDLDETVVDSTPRRLLALQLAREQHCSTEKIQGDASLQDACNRVKKVRLRHFEGLYNSYSFFELWKSLGLENSDLQIWRDGVERKTVEEYLSGRFEEFDQAVFGAVQFLQSVQEVGATVYFVSSRYEDVQGESTRRSLERLRMIGSNFFPTQLKLRLRGEPSLAFKQRAFREIAESSGESVIGVFENEPENLIAMMETFPRARAFFREGAQLGEGGCPENAHRIRDYGGALDPRRFE